MKNLKKFHHPKNLKEALRLLNKPGGKVKPIALGSMLSLSNDPKITELVDITGVGLNYITAKPAASFQVGAGTTAQDIIEAARAHRNAPLQGLVGKLLKQSAKAVGSQQIRNAVTIGGNICGLLPWSDMPAALLALDAEIYLKSIKQSRKISSSLFFQKHPVRILKQGEICTQVSFKKLDKSYFGEFIKIGRTAVDKTIMNVCVVFSLRGKKLSDVRVAVSGCVTLPQRLTGLEKAVTGIEIGKNLTETILKEAFKIKVGANGRSPLLFISDLKASAQYRKDIFETVICDAFEKALK